MCVCLGDMEHDLVLRRHTSILFRILFSYKSLQSVEEISIYNAVSPCRFTFLRRYYYIYVSYIKNMFVQLGGFPGGSDGKESASNAGGPGSVPMSGRSSREGTGYTLQYSCLEKARDRGAWPATSQETAKS